VTARRGDRIRLVHTDDGWTRLRPGALGTVRFIDDSGTVHTDWDDGSRLGLSAAAGDRWEVVGWRVTAGEAGYDVRPDGWCPALSAWVYRDPRPGGAPVSEVIALVELVQGLRADTATVGDALAEFNRPHVEDADDALADAEALAHTAAVLVEHVQAALAHADQVHGSASRPSR
jgi:Domain of unknown function (DUF4314)